MENKQIHTNWDAFGKKEHLWKECSSLEINTLVAHIRIGASNQKKELLEFWKYYSWLVKQIIWVTRAVGCLYKIANGISIGFTPM